MAEINTGSMFEKILRSPLALVAGIGALIGGILPTLFGGKEGGGFWKTALGVIGGGAAALGLSKLATADNLLDGAERVSVTEKDTFVTVIPGKKMQFDVVIGEGIVDSYKGRLNSLGNMFVVTEVETTRGDKRDRFNERMVVPVKDNKIELLDSGFRWRDVDGYVEYDEGDNYARMAFNDASMRTKTYGKLAHDKQQYTITMMTGYSSNRGSCDCVIKPQVIRTRQDTDGNYFADTSPQTQALRNKLHIIASTAVENLSEKDDLLRFQIMNSSHGDTYPRFKIEQELIDIRSDSAMRGQKLKLKIDANLNDDKAELVEIVVSRNGTEHSIPVKGTLPLIPLRPGQSRSDQRPFDLTSPDNWEIIERAVNEAFEKVKEKEKENAPEKRTSVNVPANPLEANSMALAFQQYEATKDQKMERKDNSALPIVASDTQISPV